MGAEPVQFTYFRMDEQLSMVFNNHYYVNLMACQGLLHNNEITQKLRTKSNVNACAEDNPLCTGRLPLLSPGSESIILRQSPQEGPEA